MKREHQDLLAWQQSQGLVNYRVLEAQTTFAFALIVVLCHEMAEILSQKFLPLQGEGRDGGGVRMPSHPHPIPLLRSKCALALEGEGIRGRNSLEIGELITLERETAAT